MRRVGMDAAAGRFVFASAMMLSALTGCGSFRFGLQHADMAPESKASFSDGSRVNLALPPQDIEPDEWRRTEVLSAVEAFLKRTEEFGGTGADEPIPQAVAATGGTLPPRVDEPRRVLAPSDTVAYDAQATKKDVTQEQKTQAGAAARVQRTSVVANTHIAAVAEFERQSGQALPVVKSVAIRVASDNSNRPARPVPENTTNQPLDMDLDKTGNATEDFLAHLEARAKSEGDVESHWRWRLVQAALRREKPGRLEVDGVREDVAALLEMVLTVVRNVRRVAQDPLANGQEALAAAEALARHLADQADPVIPTVAFCREVVTYGVYETIPPEDFVVGRGLPAIVYIEVENLTSEPTNEETFRTVLATRLELLTSTGESVWQREEPEIVDWCHRRRRDFFVAQRVALPATLSAGDYVLKVLVEDKLSGKANEAILPLTITAPSPVVARG